MKFKLLTLALFASTYAQAADLVQFSSGTPALASEVNANFAELDRRTSVPTMDNSILNGLYGFTVYQKLNANVRDETGDSYVFPYYDGSQDMQLYTLQLRFDGSGAYQIESLNGSALDNGPSGTYDVSSNGVFTETVNQQGERNRGFVSRDGRMITVINAHLPSAGDTTRGMDISQSIGIKID